MITGSFYRTSEHASRSLLWQVSQGFFTIVCNLMLYGIARYVSNHGGIAPWRTVSIFLGGLTLVGSLFSWYILGAPTQVRWLNKEEKKMAYVTSIIATAQAILCFWLTRNMKQCRSCFRESNKRRI